MKSCLLIATAVVLWAGAAGDPLVPCNGLNQFVAHDQSLCMYYHCANGRAYEVSCGKGTRVPSYYITGDVNPCTVKVKNGGVCPRCNVTDDRIPGANVSNQCAQFRPCATRPGCTCVDQIAGYYCSCPVTVTKAPTPANVPVPLCAVNVCQNGGTCYSLYKNDFCNCKPPYTGKFCEDNACDTTVCNNGVCTWDNFGVYCRCEQCFTGECCETPLTTAECGNCNECIGGNNCTEVRTHLCKCNPCPDKTYSCLDGLFKLRDRKCVKAPSTASDTFTLMFEDNFSAAPLGLEVYVSAAVDDNITRFVTVDAPLGTSACGYSESAEIPPGVVKRFSVNTCLKHLSTGKQNFGIRVRETKNQFVNVYCINRAQFSADGWLALPDKVAGRIFTIISYSPIISASQFSIVAITNNTVVSIYLSRGSADISGSTTGSIIIVNLNAWQTYQVQSTTNDLSGTVIESNNPIHVYSGESRGWVGPSPSNPYYDPNFPASSKSRDNLILECTSLESWGFTYAVLPLPRGFLGYTFTEEAARIAGSRPTTCRLYATISSSPTLQFNTSVLTLDASSFYIRQFYMNAAYSYFLSCDNPVTLVEITESAIPSISLINDPSFIYIPAVSAYTNFYHFVPPVYSVTDSPYTFTVMRLVAPDTYYQGIQVNELQPDVSIKPWSQIYVPAGSATDFPLLFGSIGRISSNSSTAIIHPDGNAKFLCVVEGFDNRESYGLALGASLKSLRNGTGASLSTILAAPRPPALVTVF